MTNFEPIYSALFSSVAGKLGMNTTRRALVHIDDLPIDEFPALFQGQNREVDEEERKGAPSKWKITVNHYLYVYSGEDSTLDPSSLLNPFLDLLRKSFPRGNNENTLGGLVSHCWIRQIVMMEGRLGRKEAAIINYDIVVP